MYKHNFDFKDNMEEVGDLVFEKTKDKLEEFENKFKEEVFSTLCNDVEKWLFERFENVRYQYFEGVVSFLTGGDTYCVKNKEKLIEWLQGLGYTEQTFRKKIYEENKEIINEQIGHDASYELLENLYNNRYFKSWDFGDIHKGYPQSSIVRGFFEYLIEVEGFNEEINNLLDKEIKDKISDLNYYKEKIKELESELEDI